MQPVLRLYPYPDGVESHRVLGYLPVDQQRVQLPGPIQLLHAPVGLFRRCSLRL